MRQTTERAVAMSLNGYRIAAALAQIGSYLTTYGFFAAIMKGADGRVVVLIALGAEFLLLMGKRLLFNSTRKDDAVGWSAVGLDTLLNAGGLWPYAKLIARTPTAIMLSEALGLRGTMEEIPALVVSLVFGYLLAVAPHRLWRAGGRGADD